MISFPLKYIKFAPGIFHVKHIYPQTLQQMSAYRTATGVIELEEMEFYAYHGCFEEEQRVGNRFMVQISMETDCSIPASTDRIEDALNYVTVYEITRTQMAIKSHLLEHVTARIIDALMHHFPQIQKLSVKTSKMTPPMGGQMKCVSTTLHAFRGENN